MPNNVDAIENFSMTDSFRLYLNIQKCSWIVIKKRERVKLEVNSDSEKDCEKVIENVYAWWVCNFPSIE